MHNVVVLLGDFELSTEILALKNIDVLANVIQVQKVSLHAYSADVCSALDFCSQTILVEVRDTGVE